MGSILLLQFCRGEKQKNKSTIREERGGGRAIREQEKEINKTTTTKGGWRGGGVEGGRGRKIRNKVKKRVYGSLMNTKLSWSEGHGREEGGLKKTKTPKAHAINRVNGGKAQNDLA